MTLLKRILAEKRAIIVPLVIAALLNVAVYALVVYPLGVKSAGAADRAEAAARVSRPPSAISGGARARHRQDARRAGAVDLLRQGAAGRSARRASPDLRDAAGARAKHQRQVRGAAVRGRAGSKTARLGRLQIRMVLQGDYESFRQFIYELESAPEFVIIDDVTLTQSEPGKPLTLTLELSTYYRLGANGT